MLVSKNQRCSQVHPIQIRVLSIQVWVQGSQAKSESESFNSESESESESSMLNSSESFLTWNKCIAQNICKAREKNAQVAKTSQTQCPLPIQTRKYFATFYSHLANSIFISTWNFGGYKLATSATRYDQLIANLDTMQTVQLRIAVVVYLATCMNLRNGNQPTNTWNYEAHQTSIDNLLIHYWRMSIGLQILLEPVVFRMFYSLYVIQYWEFGWSLVSPCGTQNFWRCPVTPVHCKFLEQLWQKNTTNTMMNWQNDAKKMSNINGLMPVLCRVINAQVRVWVQSLFSKSSQRPNPWKTGLKIGLESETRLKSYNTAKNGNTWCNQAKWVRTCKYMYWF